MGVKIRNAMIAMLYVREVNNPWKHYQSGFFYNYYFLSLHLLFAKLTGLAMIVNFLNTFTKTHSTVFVLHKLLLHSSNNFFGKRRARWRLKSDRRSSFQPASDWKSRNPAAWLLDIGQHLFSDERRFHERKRVRCEFDFLYCWFCYRHHIAVPSLHLPLHVCVTVTACSKY